MKKQLEKQIDLFPYLSLRLHTTAEYFFEAKSKEDIIFTIQTAKKLNVPFVMLGGGSNAVFKRSIVPGLVIKNSYTFIATLVETDATIDLEVGSGTSMAQLVQYCVEKGFSGLEYHKGLPGTVGGAVYMNSKWTHPLCYVGDSVISALLIDNQGKEKKVHREYFAFDYDYSILQKTHEFLISVVFRLQKKGVDAVVAQANESVEYRKKTQPMGAATCGCFFRNISEEDQKAHQLPTQSAGYLIDKAGMKGVQMGSFKVSEVHANFIVNQGGDARPEDLASLVRSIKEKVREKYGVELKEEVEIL